MLFSWKQEHHYAQCFFDWVVRKREGFTKLLSWMTAKDTVRELGLQCDTQRQVSRNLARGLQLVVRVHEWVRHLKPQEPQSIHRPFKAHTTLLGQLPIFKVRKALNWWDISQSNKWKRMIWPIRLFAFCSCKFYSCQTQCQNAMCWQGSSKVKRYS